jgi:hypothetical protein
MSVIGIFRQTPGRRATLLAVTQLATKKAAILGADSFQRVFVGLTIGLSIARMVQTVRLEVYAMKYLRLLFIGIAAFGWLLSCSSMMAETPTLIPLGMRAVPIAVNDGAGISPGAHVDVIGNQNVRVLENVEVIGVGNQLNTPSRRVVTLLVSPEGVNKLVAASQKGKLHLVTRN